MLHFSTDVTFMDLPRFLSKGRSSLELSSAATIAWYCFLVSVATPALACLGYCWYQRYQSHRRAMLELERANELEQMSRMEANIQIFSESERMRRIRRIQVAVANQVRKLTTADLKRIYVRQDRMMKHDEQDFPPVKSNDDRANGTVDDIDSHNNVDKEKADEGTTTHCCSICLEDFELGESVAHSSNQCCPHLFHEKCIISWLAERQDGYCPYCRRSFLCLPSMTSRTSVASQDQASTILDDLEQGRRESNDTTAE